MMRAWLAPAVERARAAGPLPRPGSAEWLAASEVVRTASVFAELLEHRQARAMMCLAAWDRRERAAGDALRQASHAVSGADDWTAVSRRPSHAELVRRRAVVGVTR